MRIIGELLKVSLIETVGSAFQPSNLLTFLSPDKGSLEKEGIKIFLTIYRFALKTIQIP